MDVIQTLTVIVWVLLGLVALSLIILAVPAGAGFASDREGEQS